jgi:hypothetical protein
MEALYGEDAYKDRTEGPVLLDWRIQCSATPYPKR